MKKHSRRLLLEQLEDRNLLANWGVPWPAANQLTVSFAPDGTLVDNSAPSTLFKNLTNTQVPAKTWQAEILRALQTWTVNANINLGMVADGGQALGSAGPVQGNPNFGDIRLAAEPLGSSVVALGTPYDPAGGTRSGDVVFNSAAALGVGQGQYDLFSVALHEVGHSFGLPDNTDPTSVMYANYTGSRTGPSASDIAMLQSLYGARTPDYYEGTTGNNTLATATTLKLPAVSADLSTASDIDVYKYTVPGFANRSITFTVQTAGLSLLTPTLTIYNASGKVIGTASSTDPLNNNVTVTLTNVQRGSALYLAVSSARSDVFGVGGYRLKIDSGYVSQYQIKLIEAALKGNIADYVKVNSRTNGTLATATDLNQLMFQLNQTFDYSATSNLTSVTDVAFYKLTAPAATASGPQTMIATVTRTSQSTLDPELTVYDAKGNQVNAEILANDGGSYTVQVVGATPGATYNLCVSTDSFDSDPANLKGRYLIGINFAASPIVLETYVDDTLSSSNLVDTFTLQSNQSQVVNLLLSATTGNLGANVQVAVRMNIYDVTGALVASLTCLDGDTVSQNVLLAQGSYTIRFVAATKDGSALPQTWYTLQGCSLTDPEDPPPVDPTMTPTGTPPATPPPIVVTTTPPPSTLPPLDPSSNPWSI